eukprot:scaffold154_cov185-Alexandrium_tamarense.AAC.5
MDTTKLLVNDNWTVLGNSSSERHKMVQTCLESSVTFRSDIPPTSVDIHPSGIIHAHRITNTTSSAASTSTSAEEHIFAWLTDITYLNTTLKHLAQHSFDTSTNSCMFIPYSSKENWIAKYPHAAPALECDEEGKVTVYLNYRPYPNGLQESKVEEHLLERETPAAAAAAGGGGISRASATTIATTTTTKKRKRGGPRLSKHAMLTNEERDELHREIYKYFSWLHDEMNEMQTSSNGRRSMVDVGGSIGSVRDVMDVMEVGFKVVQSYVEERGEGDDMASPSAATAALPHLVDGGGVMEEEGKVREEKREAPFLEVALQEELGKRLDDRKPPEEVATYFRQEYDFETQYEQLVAFKNETSHCNVPIRYKKDHRLGRWVGALREKKRKISLKGEEYEPDDRKDATGRFGGLTLTKERIGRLEALGFQWTVATKPKISWEVRFADAVEYFQTNGKWPPQSMGSLGEWIHKQRVHYTKRDKTFMEKRFAKLEEVGFEWCPKKQKRDHH